MQIMMLFVTLTAISPFPLESSFKTTDLLEYLKSSMEKTERGLSSKQELPVLRRRIKSPVLKDYDGSPYDYIGKDEPPKKDPLEGSPQLELDEAYSIFLRNHLRVTNEESVPPNFVIKNPASIEHKRKLFCRSGYLVEILPNGTVRGTQDHNSPHSKWCTTNFTHY